MESWRRCRSHGLDPFLTKINKNVVYEEKSGILDKNRTLIDTARPFLEGLFELIKSLEMVVFLTDAGQYSGRPVGRRHLCLLPGQKRGGRQQLP